MSNTRLIIVSTTIAVLVMFFSYHLYFSKAARCLKAEMESMKYGLLGSDDNLINRLEGLVDENNRITDYGKAEANRLCNIKSK